MRGYTPVCICVCILICVENKIKQTGELEVVGENEKGELKIPAPGINPGMFLLSCPKHVNVISVTEFL